MSKELEAFDRVINVFPFLEINETTNYTLEDLSNDTNLIREGLQRLEAIDNANPSEALKCWEDMQSRIASNITTIEYYTIKQALHHLEEIDKLQEQLGCPLEVICKIRKVKQIYVQKFKKYVEVKNVVIYEEATRPYIEYYYRAYAQLVKVKEVWIDDYKKTWWLKENREE